MSEQITLTPEERMEQSVQDALKLWPTPWMRYNGRIVAVNGATVGHFAPKISVTGSHEVAPGISAGVSTVEAISDTIGRLVGLGEIMERAFRNERLLRVANRKNEKLRKFVSDVRDSCEEAFGRGLPLNREKIEADANEILKSVTTLEN